MNADARDDAARPGGSPFIDTADERGFGAERPGGLSVICVLAIVLAALGLFTGCAGLGSQVSASRMQRAMAEMRGGRNMPMDKVQQEFNDRILAIAARYHWATLPLMIAKLVVEIGMLAGAILSLRFDGRGRIALQCALLSAIVVESLSAIPAMLIQIETRDATTEMMTKMMAAGGGGKGPPAKAVKGVAQTVGSIVGTIAIAVAVAWMIGKTIFYVVAVRYLRKPDIIRLFQPPPEKPSAQLA